MKKKYKNKFEKKIARQLRKHRVVFEYESQRISYILARNYIPDFIIHTPTGLLFIEAKGYLRPEHRAKMVAVKRQHPEKDIRLLFYSKNKKYIKWAEKNGFKYAIESIPKEWLIGL